MDTHENCNSGAGAMGDRLGIMLHQGGNDVTLIDQWPAHIEAIRKMV